MPAFSLIFNKLQVSFPTKKLSLSVESSVSLQYLNKNTQHMKTRHLLGLLCSGNVWVTHGNGCRIDFIFLLGSQQDQEPTVEKTIKDIAAYIRDAPLWSQISLNAELEIPEVGTNGELQSGFSIILRHAPLRDRSSHPSIPMSHASPDVQVPTHVPCFQLQKIKIVMTFNSGRANQNPQPPLPYMAVDGTKGSFAQYTSGLYHGALLCQDHEMLDNDVLLDEMDIAMPLLIAQSLTTHLPALPSPPGSQEKEIQNTSSDCGINPITSDFSFVREMAHLAFCKLAGGRQNKSQTGIKVVLHRPTLTLSKLAPSLFNPGFVEAISHRSQFIPTISHTLSVSLLRNAQSPCLRRKLLSMVSSRVSQRNNGVVMDPVNDIDDRPDYAGHQTSRSLGRVVEERLWVMLQCSLNYPLSARHVYSPENVDTSTDRVLTKGLGEISNSGPGEAEYRMKESISPMHQDLGFLGEEFEDLFGNLQDEREDEGLETLFIERRNERSIDDNFEDLFKDETLAEPDETAYTRLEGHNIDFDIITDHSVRYWEYSENIHSGDPLDEYLTPEHNISDIENEEMLI